MISRSFFSFCILIYFLLRPWKFTEPSEAKWLSSLDCLFFYRKQWNKTRFTLFRHWNVRSREPQLFYFPFIADAEKSKHMMVIPNIKCSLLSASAHLAVEIKPGKWGRSHLDLQNEKTLHNTISCDTWRGIRHHPSGTDSRTLGLAGVFRETQSRGTASLFHFFFHSIVASKAIIIHPHNSLHI